MKTKYQRMNHTEKKEWQKKYYQTAKGKELRVRFIRLNIIGITGIIFSIFLVVSGYLSQEINWATWVMAITLLLFSIVFLVGSFLIKRKVLSQFVVKKK